MHCLPLLTAKSGQRRGQGEQTPILEPFTNNLRTFSARKKVRRKIEGLRVVANDEADFGQPPAELRARLYNENLEAANALVGAERLAAASRAV